VRIVGHGTEDRLVSAAVEGQQGRNLVPSVDSSFGLGTLPFLLSVIAGATDVISFLGLDGLFTAHITGNLVILAAHIVHGGAAPLHEDWYRQHRRQDALNDPGGQSRRGSETLRSRALVITSTTLEPSTSDG
jgi:hypothetical protein